MMSGLTNYTMADEQRVKQALDITLATGDLLAVLGKSIKSTDPDCYASFCCSLNRGATQNESAACKAAAGWPQCGIPLPASDSMPVSNKQGRSLGTALSGPNLNVRFNIVTNGKSRIDHSTDAADRPLLADSR